MSPTGPMPAQLPSTPESLRRWRVARRIPLVYAVVAALVATKHTLAGRPEVGVWLYASTLAAPLGLLFVRRNKIEAAAHWQGFTILWTIFGSAAFDEPGQAPIMPILVLLVLVTTLVGGFRVGLTWGVLSMLTMAGQIVFSQTGRLSGPSALDPLQVRQLSEALATILFTLLVLLAYERNKNAMLLSVSEARDRADAAHNEAMTILNNVGEGFFNLNAAGEVTGQWSRALEHWVGKVEKGKPVWDLFRERFSLTADCWEAGWLNLHLGFLPIDVSLDSLPKRAEHGGRYYSLAYHPTTRGEELESVVCVMTDISAEIQRQEAEQERRDMFAIFQKMLTDMDGVRQFFEGGDSLLLALHENAANGPERLRILHTLKGNASVIGLSTLAEECHRLETQLSERTNDGQRDFERLRALWEKSKGGLDVFFRGGQDNHISLEYAAYCRHQQKLVEGTAHSELLRDLSSWRLQSTAVPLNRLGEQARALATRLNKSPIEVTVDDGGLRHDREKWNPLWTALIHVLRNAIDHGLEGPEQRVEAGKPAEGRISLVTRAEGDNTVIEISDDGRGIDWKKLRARAVQAGVSPNTTDVELLFWHGLSTKESVSAISGRGVGADAARAACISLGGTVEVASKPGRGTTFRMVMPKQDMETETSRRIKTA